MHAAEREISADRGTASIIASVAIPRAPHAVIVFAHGSGSGRRSPRNRFVANVLNEAGFATVLADLLTAGEELLDSKTAALRFDVHLLARRLEDATKWAARQAELEALPMGYFGASTGAAAALIAAADNPSGIFAVVSRGGRPDLAGAALVRLRAPTLLIAGGDDVVVVNLNRQALEQLRSESKLEIIPGATHLFEEAGALERAAELATDWFRDHLR